jgi:CCR4-NOT transcription complex subunit 9
LIILKKKREEALAEFSKRKDDFGNNLAPILWYSTGVVAVLIQEIVSVYDKLSPPTMVSSNRICHVLALLQPIAQHPDTRPLFLNGFNSFYLFF